MRRREFLKALGFGAAALGVARWGGAAESATAAAPGAKPNILFIAADDLRPELGCYGVTQVKTPNIDRLASRGVVFTRAYCQQPLCNATRASLLSGLRPDSTGVFHNGTHFREKNPDVITLPQHFKNNGYVTMTIGKIFHVGKEDPISWTETLKPATLGKPYLPKPAGGYQLPENRKLWLQRAEAARKEGLSGEQLGGRLNGPATECADVPDQAYADGVTADTAILALREHKNQPFFLAVGFLKPHLSFVAPKKYWDMYDPAKLQLARNPFPPKDCPPLALTSSIELRARTDIPKDGPIPADLARRLIHGYSACVSYIDAQVGRVLAELERCGLADNTIVVLWGDHGWQLGEHDLWGKVVNFETSARRSSSPRPAVTGMAARRRDWWSLSIFIRHSATWPGCRSPHISREPARRRCWTPPTGPGNRLPLHSRLARPSANGPACRWTRT